MSRDYRIDSIELRKAMIDRGVNTIKKLSELSGVDRNTIGKILNSKTVPTMNVIYAISDALNLSSVEAGRIFFSNNLHTA